MLWTEATSRFDRCGGITRPGVSELFVLYVDPSLRGQGVGTRLLEAITEELRHQGAREQWVSVTKGIQKGIPFYRTRGFPDTGGAFAGVRRGMLLSSEGQ